VKRIVGVITSQHNPGVDSYGENYTKEGCHFKSLQLGPEVISIGMSSLREWIRRG